VTAAADDDDADEDLIDEDVEGGHRKVPVASRSVDICSRRGA